MFSKRNKLMNDQRKGEKITRYGIKKYSFGAASVAVAFGIYFANGPVVTAQEVSNATSTETSIEAPAVAASESATAEAPTAESQAQFLQPAKKIKKIKLAKKQIRRLRKPQHLQQK